MTVTFPGDTRQQEPGPVRAVPVEEAGRQLGISGRHAWRLVMSGELASIRIGRLRRVTVAALEAYLSDLTA
jgi:excisionase family DNA binding protein